jgi:hypothetical protein
MKFSGKMRESGTSTPISGGKTDEWVNFQPSVLALSPGVNSNVINVTGFREASARECPFTAYLLDTTRRKAVPSTGIRELDKGGAVGDCTNPRTVGPGGTYTGPNAPSLFACSSGFSYSCRDRFTHANSWGYSRA